MLRTTLRSHVHLRPHIAAHGRRSFVSTALLTKTWESKNIKDLKQEARKRGLSANGNRASLITRLRHDDEQKALSAPAPAPRPSPPQQVRHASTEVPGVPASEPPAVFPKEYLNVHIPDISQPQPQPETPIPFLPDLWDSSRIKAESEHAAPSESTGPKIIAVAGSITHPGGGPSHNLYTEDEDVGDATKSAPTGFWGDVVHDLHIPTSLDLSAPHAGYDVHETTSTPDSHGYSRTLDKDEVKGVWVLLGLLGGAWLAGGWLQRPSAYAEEKKEAAKQAKAPEKH